MGILSKEIKKEEVKKNTAYRYCSKSDIKVWALYGWEQSDKTPDEENRPLVKGDEGYEMYLIQKEA